MPTLYILCGPAGCGKTTWARQFMITNNVKYISRDEIRYSYLKDGESYFSHEDEVFNSFVTLLANNLQEGYDVIADATHLNSRSRYKLISNIDEIITDYTIDCVSFNVDIIKILQQNRSRAGRARVDDKIVCSMYCNWVPPSFGEDKRIRRIITVG